MHKVTLNIIAEGGLFFKSTDNLKNDYYCFLNNNSFLNNLKRDNGVIFIGENNTNPNVKYFKECFCMEEEAFEIAQ